MYLLRRRGFVGSNLYDCSFPTFGVSTLTNRGYLSVVLCFLILQLALSTGDVVTLVIEMIRGFIDAPKEGPFGTLLYVLNQSAPERVAQEIFYTMNVSLYEKTVFCVSKSVLQCQAGDWFLVCIHMLS